MKNQGNIWQKEKVKKTNLQEYAHSEIGETGITNCVKADIALTKKIKLVLRGGIDWLRSMLATRLAYRDIEGMVIY